MVVIGQIRVGQSEAVVHVEARESTVSSNFAEAAAMEVSSTYLIVIIWLIEVGRERIRNWLLLINTCSCSNRWAHNLFL
jgi:hypothetical protein